MKCIRKINTKNQFGYDIESECKKDAKFEVSYLYPPNWNNIYTEKICGFHYSLLRKFLEKHKQNFISVKNIE